MKKKRLAGIVCAILAVVVIALYGYERWSTASHEEFDELLTQMPANANAILYINLDELRNSPFLAELYKWAPQPSADPDYSQFVKSTGFNYETDLNRVAIAMLKRGQDTALFALAAGRFDRPRIAAYAKQSGTQETKSGYDVYSVPVNGNAHRVSFAFLNSNRIALTNDTSLETFLAKPRTDPDTDAWRERFVRLAGAPLFFVDRLDHNAGSAQILSDRNGLHSPEFAALLNQLQWVTAAGKPGGDHLRVALEGEATSEATTRQMADVLNGLLVMAQVGLGDPKMRDQLEPQVREAYLEMLKSADVSRIDRGHTKSVRLIFDVTPQFLEAARASTSGVPPTPQSKPLQAKPTIKN